MTPVTVLISRILMSLRDVRVRAVTRSFSTPSSLTARMIQTPVPIGAFLEGVFLADDFHAVAAGDEVAESGFGDHIRCFVS